MPRPRAGNPKQLLPIFSLRTIRTWQFNGGLLVIVECSDHQTLLAGAEVRTCNVYSRNFKAKRRLELCRSAIGFLKLPSGELASNVGFKALSQLN